MEKYIAGHTGKIAYKDEKTARYISKHNKFKKDMRAYKCTAGGFDHWHVTSMSLGRYVTGHRKDYRKPQRASNLAK